MITSIHALVYSDDPAATRTFFKDVLQWPFVSDEASGGDGGHDPANWLIFRSGPSEVGVHPTSSGEWNAARHHEISLMCDDLQATMTDLRERGATFVDEPSDRGFGIAVQVEVPGTDPVLLYQPKHRLAFAM